MALVQTTSVCIFPPGERVFSTNSDFSRMTAAIMIFSRSGGILGILINKTIFIKRSTIICNDLHTESSPNRIVPFLKGAASIDVN